MAARPEAPPAALRRLARSHGVEIAYTDQGGRRRHATTESLIAALGALGVPLRTPDDAAAVLREHERRAAAAAVEPVIVAWDGRLPGAIVGANARARNRTAATITLEGGDEVVVEARRARGLRLPMGYHRLRLGHRGRVHESVILSAPRRVHTEPGRRDLGVFLPVHALTSPDDLGVGDLAGLERLGAWAAACGCHIVGTLPLLAAYLDEPFEPSPYAPVSRLFWNELYLDPRRAPELARSAEARRVLESADFRRRVARLNRARLVDYRAAAAAKRRVLEPLAVAAFAADGMRREDLERFARLNPDADDYARFRAAVERRRGDWRGWPAGPRSGRLRRGGYDERARRYHLYAQFLWREQMGGLDGRLRAAGAELYLDLPVGVHGGGYDTWRYRGSFAMGASVGAPPDLFFPRGQNWGFPPLHPEHIRRDGYRYFAACIRNHLRACGLLRIDHVAGLHRLFWIPHGLEGRDGVYIRYRAEEFYAVLSIESHRARARLVGENLGTVPPEVSRGLRRHGIRGMYIAQFEMRPDPRRPLGQPAPDELAALDTHDTATFPAYWRGADIPLRVRLGLLPPDQARRAAGERAAVRRAVASFLNEQASARSRPARRATPRAGPRPRDVAASQAALLEWLARGPAGTLLINLEDLWLEVEPQNTPGVDDHPNWRRRAGRDLPALRADGRLRTMLARLAAARKGRLGANA